MLVSPRSGRLPYRGFFCCSALILLTCNPLRADTIEITAADTPLSKNSYILNADAAVRLPENVQTALDKGVDLFFLTNVRIGKSRRWLPDKSAVNLEIIRRLSFHALTKKYVVDDLTLSKRKSFTSVSRALAYLGRYRKIPLASAALIKPTPDTRVRMRIKLMDQKLPLPLRLKKIFSRAWRLSSGWYAWPLKTDRRP